VRVVVVKDSRGDRDDDNDDEIMINGGEFGMVGVGVGFGDGWIESNRL